MSTTSPRRCSCASWAIPAPPNCSGPTPEEALEYEERLAQVLAALAALKPVTRQAFVLHRVHGHSYAEIARVTGVSVSMVEKHMMTAIAALRAYDA